MIFGILPLLILGGIVVLIVRAVGRRGGEPARESGTVTLRRFFQYVTLYGVLVVVAIGLSGIIELILPGGGNVIRRDSTENARSFAFIIVGIPVYLGIGAWVRRLLDDVRERAALGWSFYLTATLITSLLAAGFALFEIFSWMFGAESYDRSSVARFVVWGAIWMSHWFIADRYLEAPRGEGHLLAGSVAGLVATTSALGFGLTVILDGLYSNLFETGVVRGFGDDVGRAAAGLIVGGAVWALYWLMRSIRLPRTPMWHAYVLLLGVLGGLFAAIGSASTLLYTTLEWWFGDPEASTAVRQFDILPGLIATGLIGLGWFFYHRAVLAEAGARVRTEIRRIYEYIIAGVGLVGFAGGITVLLVALIQQITPDAGVIADDSAVNTLIGAITFLAVGGPIWWYFWSRIQRIRATDPDTELRSRTRRTYLSLLFGIGGVTALISLVVFAFAVLEDLFDGSFGASTIADAAPAIALVISTGALAGYHWIVFKEDREQAPAALRSPLKEVILLGVTGDGLAQQISEQLDVRVQAWDRLDEPGGPLDAAATIAELEAETHERVLVISWEGGHKIVPFTTQRPMPAAPPPPPAEVGVAR